jgi:hypothetical protein
MAYCTVLFILFSAKIAVGYSKLYKGPTSNGQLEEIEISFKKNC